MEMCSMFYLISKNAESLACRFSCVSLLTITIIASLPRRVREVPFCWYIPRYQVGPVAPRRAAKKVLGAASGTRGHIWPSLCVCACVRVCVCVHVCVCACVCVCVCVCV